MTSVLNELSRPGPPAAGSALAWSGAMAAAVLAMAIPGAPGARARQAGSELAELGRLDAEVYHRFLVSQEPERLESLRKATRSPLEIGKRAAELRDAVVNAPSVSGSLASDVEVSIRLLTFVAAEAGRLALTNARSAGSALQELEEEAWRLIQGERERLAGWMDPMDRKKP